MAIYRSQCECGDLESRSLWCCQFHHLTSDCYAGKLVDLHYKTSRTYWKLVNSDCLIFSSPDVPQPNTGDNNPATNMYVHKSQPYFAIAGTENAADVVPNLKINVHRHNFYGLMASCLGMSMLLQLYVISRNRKLNGHFSFTHQASSSDNPANLGTLPSNIAFVFNTSTGALNHSASFHLPYPSGMLILSPMNFVLFK